jgi:hypothetical protein
VSSDSSLFPVTTLLRQVPVQIFLATGQMQVPLQQQQFLGKFRSIQHGHHKAAACQVLAMEVVMDLHQSFIHRWFLDPVQVQVQVV